ncbi:hypothetical protein BLNAU_16163 [Blattamonas nauphoetae]|uniref:Uncharacterized protein n=1 Tax=Blattamonas nauphoetae TaxID=2049346 RepID=A0ABQ9XCI1_9EUKA|nr:hypothetical protein BLNAU_16163 [Blattamonas nauphoetae]
MHRPILHRFYTPKLLQRHPPVVTFTPPPVLPSFSSFPTNDPHHRQTMNRLRELTESFSVDQAGGQAVHNPSASLFSPLDPHSLHHSTPSNHKSLSEHRQTPPSAAKTEDSLFSKAPPSFFLSPHSFIRSPSVSTCSALSSVSMASPQLSDVGSIIQNDQDGSQRISDNEFETSLCRSIGQSGANIPQPLTPSQMEQHKLLLKRMEDHEELLRGDPDEDKIQTSAIDKSNPNIKSIFELIEKSPYHQRNRSDPESCLLSSHPSSSVPSSALSGETLCGTLLPDVTIAMTRNEKATANPLPRNDSPSILDSEKKEKKERRKRKKGSKKRKTESIQTDVQDSNCVVSDHKQNAVSATSPKDSSQVSPIVSQDSAPTYQGIKTEMPPMEKENDEKESKEEESSDEESEEEEVLTQPSMVPESFSEDENCEQISLARLPKADNMIFGGLPSQ